MGELEKEIRENPCKYCLAGKMMCHECSDGGAW